MNGARSAIARFVAPRLARIISGISLLAFAAVATAAIGSGTILADGASEVHIDPVRFVQQIAYAWNSEFFLGYHSGAMHLYESPATWLYAALALVHVPPAIAQRCVDFLMFLSVDVGMFWALGQLSPRLGIGARICGAAACLFNPYVAFDSNGSTPFLLLYAEIPWFVGLVAAVAGRRSSPLHAAMGVAAITLIGSGNNVPLTLMAVIVAAIYAALALIATPNRLATLSRLLAFATFAVAFTLALNVYWLLPMIDWYRTAWIGGVLDETPAMHNADSSFANVLRGLGQWAIFVGDAAGPWYRWASDYRSGPFASLLWSIPALALWAPVYRRSRTLATAFFLAVAAIATPLAVGYYHGAAGDAITTGLYDFFYRSVPGFQIYRSAYKWTSPLVFSLAGLVAISVDSTALWISGKLPAAFAAPGRWRAGAALVATCVVIAAYAPVVIEKANDPVLPLPSWVAHESDLVPDDSRHRVAVFPTQYQDRFDWGSPMYELEDGFLSRSMIHGYLGSAASRGSNQWLMRSYHAGRVADPQAGAYFALLTANLALQRDDFQNALTPDFSFPGIAIENDTSITHDILSRVMHGRDGSVDGGLRTYRLANALPSIYGVDHPLLSSEPNVSSSLDVSNLAAGRAIVSPVNADPEVVRSAVADGAIFPAEPQNFVELARTMAPGIAFDLQASSATFEVHRSGSYVGLVADERFNTGPRRIFTTMTIDGNVSRVEDSSAFGSWIPFGHFELRAGAHTIHTDAVDWSHAMLVKFVDMASLERQRGRLERELVSAARDVVADRDVGAPATHVFISRPGTYFVVASPLSDGSSAPPVVAAAMPAFARWRSDDSPRTTESQRRELTYVPCDATTFATVTMLPQQWYERPDTFRWSRGGAMPWLFAAGRMTLCVDRPRWISGAVRLRARIAVIGSRDVSAALDVRVAVNGREQGRFSLPGGRHDRATDDAVALAHAAEPVVRELPLEFAAGLNRVSFSFENRNSAAATATAAAIAPDLSFEGSAARGEAGGPAPGRFDAVATTSLDLHTTTFAGVPHVVGERFVDSGDAPENAWLAVEATDGDSTRYRLFPLPEAGPFDIELPETLPNGFSDRRYRIRRSRIFVTGRNVHIDRADRFAAVGTYLALAPNPIRRGIAFDDAAIDAPGATIVRSRDRFELSYSAGREATAASIVFRPGRIATDDALEVPVGIDMLAPSLSLSYADGKAWHLLGTRYSLRPASDASEGDRFDIPDDLEVGRSDVDAKRVSIESKGSPLPLVDAYPDGAFAMPEARFEYDDSGRARSVRFFRPPGIARLQRAVLVLAGPVSTTVRNDRLVVVAPGALVPSRGKALRLSIGFSPSQDLTHRRRVIVFSPRVTSPLDADERRTEDRLLIDGNRLAGAAVRLKRGWHVIESEDPAIPIAHIRIVANGAADPRLVPVLMVRRSSVDLTATLPSHPPALLVFGESYHPEWRATLAGRPLPHVLVDGFANGWLIPNDSPGRIVSIGFIAQRTYRWTALVSIVAAFALAVLGARDFFRYHRCRRRAAQGASR